MVSWLFLLSLNLFFSGETEARATEVAELVAQLAEVERARTGLVLECETLKHRLEVSESRDRNVHCGWM